VDRISASARWAYTLKIVIIMRILQYNRSRRIRRSNSVDLGAVSHRIDVQRWTLGLYFWRLSTLCQYGNTVVFGKSALPLELGCTGDRTDQNLIDQTHH